MSTMSNRSNRDCRKSLIPSLFIVHCLLFGDSTDDSLTQRRNYRLAPARNFTIEHSYEDKKN